VLSSIKINWWCL